MLTQLYVLPGVYKYNFPGIFVMFTLHAAHGLRVVWSHILNATQTNLL